MAYKPVERPTFFEIFKAHCSESDLGPISLNWFEELSAEAPPYEPKVFGELDAPSGWLDQTSFKTPRTKPSTYTQLASTPLIFKEQNAILPPCSSPEKELDQKKIRTNGENLISPSNTRRKVDQENEILASPPGTCHNCLAASPAILRNTYRTPQRNNMPGPYGSLFCTPKLLEVRTPKCISESLGAEVDPDMSWSSSLATPPTLGETVIRARENDSVSEAKQQDGRADRILHSFFSSHDKCPEISDTSMLLVPEAVKLNAEDDVKDLESEMLDGLLVEMDSFEDTFNMPTKSSGSLLLVPHALDAVEKCEINTDKTHGKEDVPSEQPNRRTTGISQEVKTNNWTEKSPSTEMNGSLLQNTSEGTGDGKDGCLTGHEKELESLRISGDAQDYRTHKSVKNEKPVKEAVQPSSSQWSQLNLSDLDTARLDMSVCSSPPSDLHREENLGEKSVLMTKDDAVETSLLNTSGLIKAEKLLSVNLSEKCYEMENAENSPTSEITPVKAVSLSVQDPNLVKGCAAEISKMSFLNCNTFLIEHTNVTEYSVVYNGSFSKHLKTTSKSVVTDVLSHPLMCSATSPHNCDDLRLINSENTLKKSGFKSLNMLSNLRKRSRRFIYTINNTLLYQEEKIQKEVTSGSPFHPVLPHLESDSYEFRGCQVASDVEQGMLSFSSFCLQSNTRTKNFSSCTLKMDISDNSSSNSFGNRLKQQDLRDLGGNAREDQPDVSLKCLEVSNTQKEDKTNSLNSQIISNIKHKVLTSACLMARKRSRFLSESCCLRKGEDMSANANNAAAAPQILKEELGSSPKDKEQLTDVHHDCTSATNSSFSNALSKISFGLTGVSSDCCNKSSPGKRHAADQRSGVDCGGVHRPLGMNCSENDGTGLKQGEQRDAAAFSEAVASNEEPKSVENNESPQAAALSNVAVEIAEELLGCIDNSSSNEVISEEDKQIAPMYSSKKPKENLKHKGESSANFNACSLNPGFGGFQTASNKQIKFSEASIAKGRMLFKDIEDECFEAASVERARNFSSQVKKENMLFSDSESKLGSNLSDSLDSQTSFLEPRRTQFIPHKVGLCRSFPRTPQAFQEANETLTASQEAEIAELSSILEETGSQFEFTQFRKQSNMIQSHAFQQFRTVETCGTKNVENISETREDAGFCSTFRSEYQMKNDKYCTQQEDTSEDSKVVEYEKENAVVFHKNDKKVAFTNLDIHESRRSDENFPIAKQESLSNFIGFTSAGGKKINISKAAWSRSAELFRDLDDDDYFFKSSESTTRCHNSNGCMSSNCNFFSCLGKESKEKAFCVSDFKNVNAISHTGSLSYHAQNKSEENTSTAFKENTEIKTKISINDTENANFNSINNNNSLSSIKNHKQSCKTSKRFLNQGDDQVEGNWQESSLDVTFLEDAILPAEEHSSAISHEMENSSPNQKGEDRKEDECLSPVFRTPAGGNASISDAALDHSLHLLSVQCEERDVKLLENSDKIKTNCKNMEEDTTHGKNLLVNEDRIKIGSCRHHHQIPFEQELDVGKNEVKGSYQTGFHTASGKKIAIAGGFLAKAEQFFAEDIDVGKEHNDNVENLIKKRKRDKNCVKDCDLCIESIAHCDPEKLNFNAKLDPEEPGDQFKQGIESSPIKHAVILDPVKVDTFVNLGEGCERSLVTLHVHEKADVRPGESELEALTGQKSDALSRTHLSEDGKPPETKMECSSRKKDDSEGTDDFPVHSAASLHLMRAPNDLEDNCVPGDTENTLFVEDNNKSNQSLLLTSQNSCSYLNGDSKELDSKELEHLNEPCAYTNCFTDTIVNACQNQSLVSLPDDGTNLARLKGTTLNVEEQKCDLKQTVFSTAKGRAVYVSESALARVRQMFQEDYSEAKPNSRTSQAEIARNSSSVIHAECPNSADSFNATASEEANSAISQFIEVNASASGNGHQETNMSADAKSNNKQLTSFKNSFQQEETRSFGKGQLNLGLKTEPEAILCNAPAKAEIDIDLLQTPKNYLEVEAVESARAFMEDSFSNSGVQVNAAQSFSSRLDKNFQNKTFGKRHSEENNSFGEPPIKRQLLLEFNRTENTPRSLKASKSTPDGIFKDRRKFMYHVPLKPVTCQPFGSTKERQEVKDPTLALPDDDFKGFQSKPAIFQHRALGHSSNGTSGVSTPCKASAKESGETRSLYRSGKTVKTFIPPFKTKLTFSTCEQGGSKRCDSPISKSMTEEMELNQITTEQNTAEPRDDQSCIQHAADTDTENGNLAVVGMVTNLRYARDLQEMRIKKKWRQNIRSQPGSLYVIKTSASNRISLKTAVEEKSPSFYSTEELYTYGVSKHCIQVNSTNAESFQFLVKDFFSKEYLLAGNGMQLADGGWLIPTDEGKAGKKEFYRALCDTPGVDPKLISEAWVYNHYRWIVWKLAAMEVSFPREFANRCLTPEMVLLQLKYRYDLEVDKSKRSAIKKITERDDAAGKTLVLCISKIISLNTVVSPSSSNKNVENKKAAAIIEVTDGWYGIRALLDPPLKAFLDRRRLTVGQKIIVHGAELVGSQNGCTPLEAPDSLMLKISANSTRCARWHAKLGFHQDPRPFPLPLSSLYSEGGAVGCIDVVIQRTYPIQWMEKTSAGSYVFRNSRAEEREAAKHAEDQQKKLEALFAKIQAEYEEHEERTTRRTPRSHIVTRQQIRNLQDGAELYEAIQNASDPGYMEGYLSEDQLKALRAYRQLVNDKKQTQMQEEFKKALESAEQEENGCSKRDVSAVWKLCVVDYRKQEKYKGVILSIWRPLLDICSLLKEGSRYRIYQLAASQSKGRADTTNIQLTATKKTQYLQLSVSQEMLVQIFFPRKALKFTSLLDPSFQPPCAEVDLVGLVVSVSRTGFTTMVYLSDESCNFVAVKIWTDLRHFAVEDIVVRCSLISASNLQWQSEFRSEIPVLLAGDLSVFSASPKEHYLQEKLNELRSMIENVASFCSDAESKLMNLLQRNLFLTPGLTKRSGMESPSPSCNFAEDKGLISSRIEMKHPSPLPTITPYMKLVTAGSAKTPSPAAISEDHLKNTKKRKAMDFLSCIPAPPPLTPICSVISPSVKKAFQPPRSLGLQRSKSSKETDQNTGRVTPCRKLRETVQLPENDLVADEELAMINTQALMNNLPEEKKVNYVNENSNTIATNLSGDLSSRNSSRSS
ncbi:BRCA2 protein, partial [Neopipo cinnamomea]|nr:BRCA2 protein [Neopipo cinnamomea]